jgi:hypothetical protein
MDEREDVGMCFPVGEDDLKEHHLDYDMLELEKFDLTSKDAHNKVGDASIVAEA